MFLWIKQKVSLYLETSQNKLSRQIDYAQSVLDSSYYPEDVKAAVSSILVKKEKRLKRVSSLKASLAE